MQEPLNVTNKISEAVITENSFTPEGQKDAIKYKRLVIVVEFDGVSEELQFVPTEGQGKLAYRLLALADEQS